MQCARTAFPPPSRRWCGPAHDPRGLSRPGPHPGTRAPGAGAALRRPEPQASVLIGAHRRPDGPAGQQNAARTRRRGAAPARIPSPDRHAPGRAICFAVPDRPRGGAGYPFTGRTRPVRPGAFRRTAPRRGLRRKLAAAGTPAAPSASLDARPDDRSNASPRAGRPRSCDCAGSRLVRGGAAGVLGRLAGCGCGRSHARELAIVGVGCRARRDAPCRGPDRRLDCNDPPRGAAVRPAAGGWRTMKHAAGRSGRMRQAHAAG